MIFGDADDHETGVVAAVDALHGLDDAVNCVEGLLMKLCADDSPYEGRLPPAANACSSGMRRGGKVEGEEVDPMGMTTPSTVSSSISIGDSVC